MCAKCNSRASWFVLIGREEALASIETEIATSPLLTVFTPEPAPTRAGGFTIGHLTLAFVQAEPVAGVEFAAASFEAKRTSKNSVLTSRYVTEECK